MLRTKVHDNCKRTKDQSQKMPSSRDDVSFLSPCQDKAKSDNYRARIDSPYPRAPKNYRLKCPLHPDITEKEPNSPRLDEPEETQPPGKNPSEYGNQSSKKETEATKETVKRKPKITKKAAM